MITDPTTQADNFYTHVQSSFKQAVVRELQRTMPSAQSRIHVWYITESLANKLETLFIAERLDKLMDSVYQSPDVKHFLWGVTRRFMVDITFKGCTTTKIIHSLSTAMTNRYNDDFVLLLNKPDVSNYTLEKNPVAGFFTTHDEIYATLLANQWLIAYLLLMLYGDSIETLPGLEQSPR